MTINAELLPDKQQLKLKQQIIYYNNSTDTLKKIVLRNWANSYKDNSTPLAKRLLEDYKTEFYFAPTKEKGFSELYNTTINQQNATYKIPAQQVDLVEIPLDDFLVPKDSLVVTLDVLIQLPDAKFTGHGYEGVDYFLRDWYLTPAVYNSQKHQWLYESHQNLNYQYNPPTDYKITFTTPLGYHLYSDFKTIKETNKTHTTYSLEGKNYTHADLSIIFLKPYFNIPTYPVGINTNFISHKIPLTDQRVTMQKMLFFLLQELDVFPNHQLLVEEHKYNKNPIYELKFLPDWLHPFSNQFKWEAEFFKALTTEYLTQTLAVDKKKDYWFVEGLEVYLFEKYMKQFYPDVKIMGGLSRIWGVRSMNIAKQNFTDKFSIVHQITARENLDQSLNTPLKDLSNFNKKVISPYKAGLGFMYLKNYVGQKVLDKTIADFLYTQQNKATTANAFLALLQQHTDQDISWFQKEWLGTKKKIDHKISTAKFKKDSVQVVLKNKRSIKTPVAVYGLKGKKIKSKTWVNGFTGSKTITIANDSLDKVVLNYENIYPEINHRNNWKNKHPKLFERPLQIKLLKDYNNPRKHQVFLKPEASYNYYDGIILGLSLQNKAYMHKNFEYMLKPTYSTLSKSITGGFNLNYRVFPEKTSIYEYSFGISGSNYHYDNDLNYNTLSPYISFSFKQKNLRAIGINKIRAMYLAIDKEVLAGLEKSDEDQYQLFKVDYEYRKNQLIHDYRLNTSVEVASKFSKLNLDFRYRHLTNNKRPIEFRFFGGVFFSNRTQSDYFSYNQHTPNDYLFELPYLGRSENSGILSQQYFKAQGGFVSQNQPGFANQWLTSVNTSVGIWRWIETFQNVSLQKSKFHRPFFDYEGGVRLNFVPDLFELYLPIYNKEGWVTNNPNYLNTIRFTVTLKAQPIVKFLKQQLF
ncbi:gluzincin family metallopeptidase [Ochrovirga pacifica]|uniref:M1 family aminopeptidase n=1 Tax=Ochrovirga pacifica TaxID=1042376 RepID=UPI0002558393|nr:M1 family aminopeptidase [Ochrovirga pacifica]